MRRMAWCWVLAVLAVTMLAGCGGGQQATAEESAETPAAEMAPDQLGKAIGDVYLEKLTAVGDLLKDRPEPAVVRPKLEALKADAIERLVELGKQKETLSAADQATVNGAVRIAISQVPSSVFSAYADGQSHYFSIDHDLADLIASFNVITQYADFELLKKQEPDEAKRLGIE